MESKKNKKVNLERKRTAFFNIGLLGAGAFTLAAFTYQDEITDPNEEHYSSSAHIEYVLEDVEPEVKEPEVKLEMEEPTTEDPSSQSMDAGSVSENSQASSNSSNTPEGGITGIGAPKPPKGPHRVTRNGAGTIQKFRHRLVEFAVQQWMGECTAS